jgi:hypothetical protein
VSATLVEEEEKSPMMVDMEIDSHDSEQGLETVDSGNLHQPTRAKVTHRTNGDDNERT